MNQKKPIYLHKLSNYAFKGIFDHARQSNLISQNISKVKSFQEIYLSEVLILAPRYYR